MSRLDDILKASGEFLNKSLNPLANVQTGSWGTKDYGASELLGAILGKSRTSQGGSNILGNSSSSSNVTTSTTPTTTSSGQVAGANTKSSNNSNSNNSSGNNNISGGGTVDTSIADKGYQSSIDAINPNSSFL